MDENKITESVKYWLEKTIIGFNFCPFAKKEFLNKSIHYEVVDESNTQEQLFALSHELKRLDESSEIETTLFILPVGLESFFDYLDFLELANDLNIELGYEGTYQLASFHPDYCFADAKQDAPANYTNRSPVAIIHIIRESSLERVLAHYSNPEEIPVRNISMAEEKGIQVFEDILKGCKKIVREFQIK